MKRKRERDRSVANRTRHTTGASLVVHKGQGLRTSAMCTASRAIAVRPPNQPARAKVSPVCRRSVAVLLDLWSEWAYSEVLMLTVNVLRNLGVVFAVLGAGACGGSLGPRSDAGRDVVAQGSGGSGGRGISEDAGGDSASGTGGRAAAAGGNGGTTAVRACKTTTATTASKSCRVADECGPIGPYKCCTGEPCWLASACPIPATTSSCASMSSRFQCMISSDCAAGGTCVSTTMGCPQCEYRSCKYPPPPPPVCTQAPDSCGADARCQTDGTGAPLLRRRLRLRRRLALPSFRNAFGRAPVRADSLQRRLDRRRKQPVHRARGPDQPRLARPPVARRTATATAGTA